MMRLLIAVLFMPLLASAAVKDQLGLFFELSEQDSIVKILHTGIEELTLELWAGDSAQPELKKARIPQNALEKIKEQARSEGLQVEVNIDPSVPSSVSDSAMSPAVALEEKPSGQTGRSTSQKELKKNRRNYVLSQTLFSTYVYGLAVPIALELSPEKFLAIELLAIPTSFLTHFFLARGKDYYDSHIYGTNYFSTNSIFLSYTLPFLAMGPTFNAFRVGNFAVLAAYPLGLHLGYKHGTRFQENPGRIVLQSSFSGVLAAIGYISALTWAEWVESAEVGVRLLVAQAVGGAVGGHYLSYRYRAHERVPEGIGPGLGIHAILGGMVGGTLLLYMKPDNVSAIGLTLSGAVGAGFGQGLYFLRDKYDSFERAGYHGLGMAGGMVLPLGLMMLFESFPEPEIVMTALTAGAIGGYAFTRFLTRDLVERPLKLGQAKNKKKSRLTLNLMPYPEAYIHQKEVRIRAKVPLLNFHFN